MTTTLGSLVVVGASRGIGAAVAGHVAGRSDALLSVSRTPSAAGRWVAADVTTPEGINAIVRAVDGGLIDALLYMGGTWEKGAFTTDYKFDHSSDAEIRGVLDVNLIAPILLSRALLPALRRSENPKIVLMGALSALDNASGPEVANTASKFGLRGAAQALRESLRPDRVAVTVINPGNVATPEVVADLAAGRLNGGDAIPMADLLAVIDCVLSLSRESCLKEINLAAMNGRDV